MRPIIITSIIIITASAFFCLGWFMKEPEILPVNESVVVDEQQRISDSIMDAEYPEYQVYGMHQEKDWQRQTVDRIYKFRFSIVGGCTTDDKIRAAAEKQNKITDRIMIARYGKDWLDKFENSVDSLYTLDSLSIEIARQDRRIANIETKLKAYNTHLEPQYSSGATPNDNIRMVTLSAEGPSNGKQRYMNHFRAAVDLKRSKIVNLDTIPF